MPAVMEQVAKMSREEQLKLANWILDGIRNGSVNDVTTPLVYRTTEPDPALKGEILCDLFKDESKDWESA